MERGIRLRGDCAGDAGGGVADFLRNAAPGSPFSQAASPPVSVDPETVLALADNAAQKAEMAVTAYQTLARVADTQVRQVRRQARAAWAAVAVMAVGVTGAVGWTTHRLTRATGEVEHLQQEVFAQKETTRALSDKQDKLLADRAAAEQALRAEFTARHDAVVAERTAAEQQAMEAVSAAREEAARAEGQLAAYREQEAARQTRETVAAAAAVTATPPVLSFGASVSDPFDTSSGIESLGRFAAPASDAARLAPALRPPGTPRRARAPRGETPPPAPTTRQSAPRRKAAPPTTRPAVEVSDAPAAAPTLRSAETRAGLQSVASARSAVARRIRRDLDRIAHRSERPHAEASVRAARPNDRNGGPVFWHPRLIRGAPLVTSLHSAPACVSGRSRCLGRRCVHLNPVRHPSDTRLSDSSSVARVDRHRSDNASRADDASRERAANRRPRPWTRTG